MKNAVRAFILLVVGAAVFLGALLIIEGTRTPGLPARREAVFEFAEGNAL